MKIVNSFVMKMEAEVHCLKVERNSCRFHGTSFIYPLTNVLDKQFTYRAKCKMCQKIIHEHGC